MAKIAGKSLPNARNVGASLALLFDKKIADAVLSKTGIDPEMLIS